MSVKGDVSVTVDVLQWVVGGSCPVSCGVPASEVVVVAAGGLDWQYGGVTCIADNGIWCRAAPISVEGDGVSSGGGSVIRPRAVVEYGDERIPCKAVNRITGAVS